MAAHPWEHERKIATLRPDGELTPQQVLARSLDKAKRIKAVAVVILWDDSSCAIDNSSMKMSEMCFMLKNFDLAVLEELKDPR